MPTRSTMLTRIKRPWMSRLCNLLWVLILSAPCLKWNNSNMSQTPSIEELSTMAAPSRAWQQSTEEKKPHTGDLLAKWNRFLYLIRMTPSKNKKPHMIKTHTPHKLHRNRASLRQIRLWSESIWWAPAVNSDHTFSWIKILWITNWVMSLTTSCKIGSTNHRSRGNQWVIPFLCFVLQTKAKMQILDS